ncbi:hypothetical protein HOLleu_04642 [Holothuria leucospilota]|uniref:Uncharacterized protein n=1 Tax=Holothuria leucospilota TaxID=206669 RepID=A0A9Q1HID6_HOLLE|nr:hypothetical protein HOLleu_04642 [Holothuria leucospilota]
MTKISALFCILLAFFSGKTFACPSGCTCLETEITCTNLNTLPDASDLFTNPNQVETVSITDSPSVTEIPDNFFSDLPMLTTLDVSGNPIDCSGSDNDWIKTWLAAVATSTVTGDCSDGTELNMYTDLIADVVPVSLTFDDTSYTVDESETQSVVVSRDGDTSTPLNVRVMVELSEAKEEDFMISNKQLTIATGESSTSFDVTVVDNTKKDPEGWGFMLKLVPESIIIRSSSASVSLVDNDPNVTVPPVVTTTQNIDTSVIWIVLVVLLVLVVVIVIVIFIWKKKQDRKRTSASSGQGDYAAVQKDGDGKVYSATTEEIA